MKQIRYRIYAVIDHDPEASIGDELDKLRECGTATVLSTDLVTVKGPGEGVPDAEADFTKHFVSRLSVKAYVKHLS